MTRSEPGKGGCGSVLRSANSCCALDLRIFLFCYRQSADVHHNRNAHVHVPYMHMYVYVSSVVFVTALPSDRDTYG